MRKISLLLLFTLIYQLISAQIPDTTNQDKSAVIYFFRLPAYTGSAAKMTILSNNQPIVRLRNASYFKYTVLPGNYVFSFSFGSGSEITLNAEAGKEYYFKCYLNVGLWSGIPILEPVDPASGRMILEGNRLAKLSAEPISTKARNSRLGIMLIGGIGFENYPFFTDENNDEVTLSTGGGFGIGAGPGIYTLGTMKVDASEINYNKYTFKYKTAAGFHAVLMFDAKFMERGSTSIGIRYNKVSYEFTSAGSSHLVNDPKLMNPDGSAIDFILGYNLLF